MLSRVSSGIVFIAGLMIGATSLADEKAVNADQASAAQRPMNLSLPRDGVSVAGSVVQRSPNSPSSAGTAQAVGEFRSGIPGLDVQLSQPYGTGFEARQRATDGATKGGRGGSQGTGKASGRTH
jgi:hypothetical protein